MKKFLGLISRCKDEFFVREFCDYYLKEGFDSIHIIDDDSSDKSIYNDLKKDGIAIHYENNIIARNYANTLYRQLRDDYEWIAYFDIDEFVVPRKNSHRTIREEIESTFSLADCIKIPWVMMSCNGRKENPESILNENIFRWNHDLRHPHPVRKFRCRYENIETKSIFRPSKFAGIKDHFPIEPTSTNLSVVDSIRNNIIHKPTAFYHNLREQDIKEGYLLCYHYRIISSENCENKIKNNFWYKREQFTLEDLMSSDHPDLIDCTLRDRLKK